MAIEAKRGCGYRKIGGLYFVAGKLSAPCDRLPFPLTVCPCCGGGIKFTRGWTWITPFELLQGTHAPKAQCQCFITRPLIRAMDEMDYEYANCPACSPLEFFGEDGRAGLIWIGAQHYKTPGDFTREGAEQGISRRIKAIPRGFELGKTWIFVAHIEAVHPLAMPVEVEVNIFDPQPVEIPDKRQPGIFAAFKPQRIERIVKQSEYDLWQAVKADFAKEPPEDWSEAISQEYSPEQQEVINRLKADENRGITLIPVPDDDPDHQ